MGNKVEHLHTAEYLCAAEDKLKLFVGKWMHLETVMFLKQISSMSLNAVWFLSV